MKIKLFGLLRQKAGFTELEVPGATIREALEAMCADNETLRAAVFDGDVLRPYVRVLVNGHDSELNQGLGTVVSTNDEIAIFPPIAGG